MYQVNNRISKRGRWKVLYSRPVLEPNDFPCFQNSGAIIQLQCGQRRSKRRAKSRGVSACDWGRCVRNPKSFQTLLVESGHGQTLWAIPSPRPALRKHWRLARHTGLGRKTRWSNEKQWCCLKRNILYFCISTASMNSTSKRNMDELWSACLGLTIIIF